MREVFAIKQRLYSEKSMKKKKFGLIFKLTLGILVGFGIGLIANEQVMSIINTIKTLLGSVIFFAVPLVIFGFVTPAITGLKQNASKMLGAYLGLSYGSAVGASLFAAFMGYTIIPYLNIASESSILKKVPDVVFTLAIPPVMPVMSALALAILVGLSVIWTNSTKVEALLYEAQSMILAVINKVIVPILPFFIATTFTGLAYTGTITKQLPVFGKLILIALVGHFIWLTFLFTIGALVSKTNPFILIKHYIPVYVTAMGTMSSAATLPVAIKAAKESKALPDEVTNFAIPLGATTHLCGSVLTETLFCMAIAQILYGQMPTFGTILIFTLLFGIFAVGAPGVPGGTVMASLAIVVSVLGFDTDGVALLIAIFAIQDSFGTACNVTGDGALALILKGMFYGKEKVSEKVA